LFWDSANSRLGVGTNAPPDKLVVYEKTGSTCAFTATSISMDPAVYAAAGASAFRLTTGTMAVTDESILLGVWDGNGSWIQAAKPGSTTRPIFLNPVGNKVTIGTTTPGASKLTVADDSIQVNTAKTPASAAATGTVGQICWDSSYVYVCVATNTWKRAAIATW
jgi:hypothetical protein